jgi:gliding motility-associated-like protein
LNVNNASAGVLSGVESICVGGSGTFSSTVSGGIWSSSNIGIVAINASSGVITGVSAGTSSITYTVSGTGGCLASVSSKILTVNQISAGILSGVQSICVGKSATFSSTVSGGVWSSSNIGIAAINASSGLLTGVASGISTITYTIAGSGGCPAVLSSYSLVVAQLPVAQIQTPLTNFICQNSNLLLVATGGETYKWFIDNTEIVGANTNKFNATKPGSYFTQTISKEGCVSEKSALLILTLIAMPEVDFSNDKYCAKTYIQFSNLSKVSNSGLVSYSWSFGDGSNSTVTNPTYTFSKEGLYKVTLSVTPIGCPNLVSQQTKNIAIEINPGNLRYKAINVLIGQIVQLTSRTFQNATYDWSPAIGLNNYKILNPLFNHKQEIDYKIKIVNQAGCSIVDTQLVRVFDRVEIYVPDAFSPNSDSKNDQLIPKLIGIQKLNYFKIFNRWGQIIFSSNKEGDGWDGFYNGLKQQIDTYAWQCEGVDLKGDIIRRSGTFILIR